jgi:hypothetical protein
VLITAVVAMMILAVLSLSFALLARMESKLGVNFKQYEQAVALAIAGLERARDTVRTASIPTASFTPWLDGTEASHLLTPGGGVSLGAGRYWARIDNDCAALTVVPAAIQEPAACTNLADTNGTGVITAWARVGTGRARVRAIVTVDHAWKHVCSDARPDANGYCNDPGNQQGNPSVSPSDRNDPNGPQAWDDLPRPTLGCSAVDPTVHDATAGCALQSCDYPYTSCPTGQRLVVTGDRSLRNCDGGGQQYSGYFDCALTTPCDAAVCGTVRKACVRPGDTRAASAPALYVAASGTPPVCPTASGVWQTGMVFRGGSPDLPTIGAAGDGRNVYALRTGSGAATTVQGSSLHGTLVVEGNALGCGGTSDFELKNSGRLYTETTNVTHGQAVYGYPLALLLYDPTQPAPTITPYAPQDVCSDMGSANTSISGMVYSAGHVSFNPINMTGSVVAFEIQLQASSSSYNYSPGYGIAAPPPGFPLGASNRVVVIRKSFIVCRNYADDSGGPTACE